MDDAKLFHRSIEEARTYPRLVLREMEEPQARLFKGSVGPVVEEVDTTRQLSILEHLT